MKPLLPSPRHLALDALRGLAVLWMSAYHFAFDLQQFRFISQDFYNDPRWTVQRTCILSLFLLCAGAGQALAQAAGQSWQRFAKRWLQIAGCAIFVSLGSAWMFHERWIYFGVLHGMLVMLLVCRATAHWGRWLWLAGAVPVALGLAAQHLHAQWPELAVLDGKAWSVLGLVRHKPLTEDYVPLLPWLGVMWWGVAAGQWAAARGVLAWEPPAILIRPISGLAFVGRWSLSWYMVHQPLLIGALMALS